MRKLETDHCTGYEMPEACPAWERDMHEICARTHYKRAHSWSSQIMEAVHRAAHALSAPHPDAAKTAELVNAAVDVARALARWRPHYGRNGDDAFIIPEPGDFARLKDCTFAELLAGLVAMLRFAQESPHQGTRIVYSSAARDVALEIAHRIAALDRR